MKAKVVGISELNFLDKEGTQIEGTSLFVSYPDDRVTGLKCDKFFIKKEVALPSGLKPGDDVVFSFNRYGKVASVQTAVATKA